MTRLDPAFLARPIAHRALHDQSDARPENSAEAIKAAIAHGYGIEIDLQLSRDQQAMVFHDYDLERLLGEKGPIQQSLASDLSNRILLGGVSGVPTFVETLAMVNGRVPLLVELKDQDGEMGPNVGVLEQAVAEAIAEYDGPVALMSFNPHSADTLRALCPQRSVGLTTCAWHEKDWPTVPADRRAAAKARTLASEWDFISHDRNDLDMAEVSAFKASGKPVLCWTVKSEEQARDALKVADAITFEQFLPA